jgi:serine/threonine protein kinase
LVSNGIVSLHNRSMKDSDPAAALDVTVCNLAAGKVVFDRYVLTRILGHGGMGIVWLARDGELERDVALKFLPEPIVRDRAVLTDLKRETRRCLDLTHPHIVRIHDFVQDAETACISMEFVDGDTLSNMRSDKSSSVFEPEELGSWTRQLCDALDYAHKRARIVHRDLKPSNLMVNSKHDLKVTDFGIARSLSDSVSKLTMARGTSGTLVYMSPQQLDGERASHLDDVYSLGATLYELLTSRPPFYSGGLERQIHQRIPPSIKHRREELDMTSTEALPLEWETTIAACLAKDPAQRPSSAGDVASRLGLLGQFPPPSHRPVPSKTAPVSGRASLREKKGLLAGVLVTLLLTGVLARWWFGHEQPRQETQRRQASTEQGEKNQSDSEAARRQEKAEQERREYERKVTAEKEALAAAQRRKEEEAATLTAQHRKEEEAATLAAQRRKEEEARRAALPNMNKQISGIYTYGPGYAAAQRGKSVVFELKSVQEDGSNRFEGVMNEPHTDFGTPMDKRLWADVRGEILSNSSTVKVRFTKTYRYFQQASVIYEGNFDPSTGEITGTWKFSTGGARETGTFTMK